MHTIPYYIPTGLAAQIFQSRYAITESESFPAACDRVAQHVARAESGENIAKYQLEFAEALKRNLFMPGGRTWYGSGRPHGQLGNCFCVTTSDSREGWGKTVSDTIVISGTGGGVGINFSPIRPRGTPIRGTGGEATGAVSLMTGINAFAEVIKGGGGRRCLPAGTRVHTRRGGIPIEEVVVGDQVMTDVGYRDVTGWFDQGSQSTYRILLESGAFLSATSSHRFAVLNDARGGYVFKQVSELQPDDKLLFIKKPIDGQPQVLHKVDPKRDADRSNVVFRQPQLDTETAWMMGLVFSDGYVGVGKHTIKGKEGNCEVGICLHATQLSAMKRAQDWFTRYGIASYLKKGDGKCVVVRTNQRQCARWFAKYKQPKTALIIPEEIWRSPSDVRAAFVAGVMDGDGCFSNRPTCIAVSVYEEYSRDLAKLLATLGIVSEIKKLSKKQDGWQAQYGVYVKDTGSLRILRDTVGSYTSCGEIVLRKGRQNGYTIPRAFARRDLLKTERIKWDGMDDINADSLNEILGINHYVPVAVSKVELWRNSNTYDIEVADGHVFVAEGYLTHNSASMFALNHNHGDIVEFLDAKLDLGKLNNANISVIFEENPELFFEQVKKDKDTDLKFRGKVVGKVRARDLWKKMLSNALKGGEPGILNQYLANKMSNTWYCAPLCCVNPCSELWLSDGEACSLAALVLPRFVNEKNRDIQWDVLKQTIFTAIRFLDNVVSVNHYPLPENREVASKLRRIGLGVMGLHDTLLLLGLKYSGSAGLEMVDKIMGRIKNWSYEASIALSVERGAFPAFDSDQYVRSGFIKTLKPSLREAIREHGMRNCTVNTMAPTGTTSMVAEVSSGIEPMFGAAYLRRFQDGDTLAQEVVVHPLFKRFLVEGKSVKHFQGTHEVKLRDHFEMQRLCQRHLDSAVSKTINIAHDVSEETLSDLFMEYLPELKGCTIYPDGSRDNQPLTPMNLDEAIKYCEEHKDVVVGATEGKCKSGVCEI